MKDELNSKILTGKQLNNTYLIRHHGYYEIKESIIPDIEAYDLFSEIKEKTKTFTDYLIDKLSNGESLYIKVHLIYIGDEIKNITDFESFTKNNKDSIIGVYHYPTKENESINQGYTLPYYEMGSFYFDYEQFLNTLKDNNIKIKLFSSKESYDILVSLSKTYNYVPKRDR